MENNSNAIAEIQKKYAGCNLLMPAATEVQLKQDEIIYRMTALLKSYVREIHNLRTINGFFEVDSNQEIDEKILEECMDQYEEMKE